MKKGISNITLFGVTEWTIVMRDFNLNSCVASDLRNFIENMRGNYFLRQAGGVCWYANIYNDFCPNNNVENVRKKSMHNLIIIWQSIVFWIRGGLPLTVVTMLTLVVWPIYWVPPTPLPRQDSFRKSHCHPLIVVKVYMSDIKTDRLWSSLKKGILVRMKIRYRR